jgi:transposase-like protein
LPELLDRFNRCKRPVTRRWHVDETYIKVCGQWRYRYERSTATATRSNSGLVSGAS